MSLKNMNIERTECLKSWLLSNITAGEGLVATSVMEDAFDILANQEGEPKKLLPTTLSQGS